MIFIAVALALIVILLAGILFTLSRKKVDRIVSIGDADTGDTVEVVNERLRVHDDGLNLPAQMSDAGKLVAYGAGLLEVAAGFNGPIVFFRNDNQESKNFYIDFIAYSWYPRETIYPLSVVSIVYDCTEPDGSVMTPVAISMNQNFPNAAIENGVYVRAWAGGTNNGMTGSVGGRGLMVFTLQPQFRMIDFHGKLIIGPGGTQRFDLRADGSGYLRFAVVGWFDHSASGVMLRRKSFDPKELALLLNYFTI